MKKALLLIILLVAACTPQQETINIGVSTILSGEFASAGLNIVQAAELALEEIPHEGLNIKLIPEDAKCGEGQGITAAMKLIEIDHVQAIIGATCSDDTMAVAPYVNEKKIVYLTPVTGGSNIDNAGEYIFRIGNADVLAGIQPAKDFITFNYTNAAVLTEQREYTLDISEHFKGEYQGEIVFDEEFIPDTVDFRTTIVKMKQKDPDVILVLSQMGSTGAYFIKQTRVLGIDVPIFTTFTTVANQNAQEIMGNAMEGIYFYDPDYDTENPELLAFFKKYEEKYGTQPVIPFHAAATYDTTVMLVKAIEAVGNDGEKIHDWLLENVQDWSGFMGEFSLDEKGNTQVGYKLKQVKDGEFVEITT